MPRWTARQLQEAAKGRWLRPPAGDVAAVGTDSRAVTRGQLFVALRGEKFDGHDYLQSAAAAGAAAVMIDRPDAAANLPDPCGVLLVDDCLAALSRLASSHRRSLNARVIAVTGSVGKTTTKHLIHSILSKHLAGSASPRSFNNHIGVPLTLLAAEPTDRYVVAEVGTNAPGEIETLGRIIEPDAAVITAIAPVHLQGLGGIEGVLREKTSLIGRVRPNGAAILNADAPGLLDAARRVAPPGVKVISYGTAPATDLLIRRVDVNEHGLTLTLADSTDPWLIPIPGRHNAHNIAAAIAVARWMGLPDPAIRAALAHADLPPMRLDIRRIPFGESPITLINDAYNANPVSMAAGLAALRDTPAPARRIAILGDMLELGPDSDRLHRELGHSIAADPAIDAAVFIGPQSAHAGRAAAARLTGDALLIAPAFSDTLASRIAALLRPGDTILLKASRGMALERLIPFIERQARATTPATHAGAAVTDDA